MTEFMNDLIPDEGDEVPEDQELEDTWDDEWGEYQEPESDDDAGIDDDDPELNLPV